MKKILLVSLVLSILSFSCKTNVEKTSAPAESSWEKQSALSAENQDNIVSGGRAIAAMTFVVVLTVLLLTMRTTRPIQVDWMYQGLN